MSSPLYVHLTEGFLTWLEGFDGDKSGHAAQEPGKLPLVHLTEGSLTWLEGFDGDKSGHATQEPGELPLVHLAKGALSQFLITKHRLTLNLVLTLKLLTCICEINGKID